MKRLFALLFLLGTAGQLFLAGVVSADESSSEQSVWKDDVANFLSYCQPQIVPDSTKTVMPNTSNVSAVLDLLNASSLQNPFNNSAAMFENNNSSVQAADEESGANRSQAQGFNQQ